MNELIRRRLANQRLLRSLRTPVEVVSWLGAMQAQDYPGARWGIGLRAAVTDRAVERACDEGLIIRTHILRQTWHFVARDDTRWMLALSGPRVNAVNAHYYRRMELDERTFTRSRTVIERVLRDGVQLTRPEIGKALHRAGITATGNRLAFLTMRAELDAVIVNGARRGNQLTYALLDDRVPRAKAVDRDAALAMLAQRYFASHGPATLRDFVWWSGLTIRDARAAIELAGSSLDREDVDELTYWSVEGRVPKTDARSIAYLLPNYDEYLIAYKDRDLVVDRSLGDGGTRIKDPFVHHLVVDGRLAGSWTRTLKGDSVSVECATYLPPTRNAMRAIENATARLGEFLERPATFSLAGRR